MIRIGYREKEDFTYDAHEGVAWVEGNGRLDFRDLLLAQAHCQRLQVVLQLLDLVSSQDREDVGVLLQMVR